jgi:BolA protein
MFKFMSIAATMREKLSSVFAPLALEIEDQSARHAGHAGATRDDGSHGETHFHVRLVSAAFEGMSRVERQRRVYAALKDELAGPVHALSLAALTPAEAERSA